MATRGAPRRHAPVTTDSATRTLQIERLVAGGDGLARDDGFVIFVPRSIPGESVLAEPPTQRGRVTRAWPQEIRTASPSRVPPRCGHFVHDRCGGCQWQHLAYDAQREAKSALIVEAFARIAKRTVAAPVVEASPTPWRYRRKLTLALRRRGGRWIAGLHRADAPGAIIPIDDCPITDESVVAVWRAILAVQHWLPPGDEGRASVRLHDDGSASFVFEGGERWPAATRFFEAVPALRSVWWHPTRGHRRRLALRRTAGDDDASFVQVNTAVAEALRAHVEQLVRGHAPRHVIDAYAGSGDGAARLAAQGMRVTAIEADPDAAAVAARRLAPPSVVLTGTVEGRLTAALPADVLLVNPPRTGLHAAIPALLGASAARPRALIYTSCDPATLARDVARLSGWVVRDLRAFDMFPQTAHVETVCVLTPECL